MKVHNQFFTCWVLLGTVENYIESYPGLAVYLNYLNIEDKFQIHFYDTTHVHVLHCSETCALV